MRYAGVIPARFDSTRLPGKALIDIAGKPMVQWVYERASQAACLQEVVVATDDERILRRVEGFGGKALMTGSEHASGTDRVAEVALALEADVLVNIQGDEPLIQPDTIEKICAPFEAKEGVRMSTARVRITDPEEINSPHAVKVVVDCQGNALYFSRATIPYVRNGEQFVYKHLGIYAYSRECLKELASMRPTPLEQSEGLEQLRALENGIEVRVVEVSEDSLGVDTIQDLERVRPLVENGRNRS